MLATSYTEFVDLFRDIEDPRQDEKLLYPLHEVIFMVMVGVLGGQETWPDIIYFCEHKLHVLRKYFAYENGLPSISTTLRVLALIDKKKMESWLLQHASMLIKSLAKEQICIDGKSLKGKRKFENVCNNTHTLNVFASNLGLVISGISIKEKTNELTAIKELLQNSNLDGATVSIDAIGCQKEITRLIKEKGGDYFLSLKKNQRTLYEDVKSMFESNKTYEKLSTEFVEKGHGRIEHRKCETINDVTWLKTVQPDWIDLESVSMITRTRVLKGSESTQVHYYISSSKDKSSDALEKSRNHWLIENQLHWVLDVQFGEDKSLIRKGNAAENMASIRRLVLNICKNYKDKNQIKVSPNKIRKSFSWSESNMEKILDSWLYGCS